MTVVAGKNVYIYANAFSNNRTIVNVDLCYVPFDNNSMSGTFNYCNNLLSVTNINQNVTNMSCTFGHCTSLVNAPTIPDSVTNMHRTFDWCNNLQLCQHISNSITTLESTFRRCINLQECPHIPNSVTSLLGTFEGCQSISNTPEFHENISRLDLSFSNCFNLTSISNIPASVTNVWSTFRNCTNFEGNIYIQSNKIINAVNCFYDTSLTKNVYIPFEYNNGVPTLTYNSFINAGYGTSEYLHGVHLMDITGAKIYINPTPNDATVLMHVRNSVRDADLSEWTYTNINDDYELQTYIGANTIVNVPSVYLNVNNAKVPYNETVDYIVYKDGYYTEYNNTVCTGTETINVQLHEIVTPEPDNQCTFTIIPLQIDATVTLTADGYTQEGNSITVPKETSVNWSVSRQYCTTQSGTVTINNNFNKIVSLDIEVYTFTINPTPADAEVKIFVNGNMVNATLDDWTFTVYDENNNLELQTYTGSSTDIVMPTTYNLSNSTQVIYSDVITYYVMKNGYKTVSDTLSLSETTTLNIELEPYRVDVSDYNYTNTDGVVVLTQYIGAGGDIDTPVIEKD